MKPSCDLLPLAFDDLNGWRDDQLAPAFLAFKRSAGQAALKPYRTGGLGLSHEDFVEAYEASLRWPEEDARHFFETFFRPFRIASQTEEPGFVTGFYEPVATASPVQTSRFRFPLRRRPHDLVDITDHNRPQGFDPYLAFGRHTGSALEEYPDRAAIEAGALEGLGLEFAWLDDPVDVFFIHVQGAARLRMTDGSECRITYAAKSGQRFTGPGSILAKLGEIRAQDVTMQTIRAWFRANPHRINEILQQNRSYIFFKEAPADPDVGPIAAAKVPLTAGRSMAVDRLIHTFGTPFFVQAESLDVFDRQPFRRLMIAQDTGSAIIGAARGDLFTGTGPEAGNQAGVIRHPAVFTVLVPLPAVQRYQS